MSDKETSRSDDLTEYERFEQAAKKLFSLTPEADRGNKKRRKRAGIEPDLQDFEPEEPENR
jgi:hypothetical protein